MPPKKQRTYGSKRPVVAAGSSAIFGGYAESLVRESVDDLIEAFAETGLGVAGKFTNILILTSLTLPMK